MIWIHKEKGKKKHTSQISCADELYTLNINYYTTMLNRLDCNKLCKEKQLVQYVHVPNLSVPLYENAILYSLHVIHKRYH